VAAVLPQISPILAELGVISGRVRVLPGMRLPDDSIALMTQGYAYLPNRRRAADGDAVELTLLGQRAVAGCGPDWTRQFYDETYVERSEALPGLVKNTLVGQGAVHTLDAADHRHRKGFFLDVLDARATCRLARSVLAAWQRAEPRWRSADEIVLFDEAAAVLLDGVWDWAGLPETDVRDTAADMVAMVDAFGAVGPRNWRGRLARNRQERRLSSLVEEVRQGRQTAPEGTLLEQATRLTTRDGEPLDPKTVAVELLNVIRPTVATAWFVAYSAHALERNPALRPGLASEDPVLTTAFAHEVRRFYPFAPLLGGTAVTEASWGGLTARPGDLVVLDIYGQHHHPDLWEDPYRFDPLRFAGVQPDPYTFVPQGGGSPESGHRCPGEPGVVMMLEVLLPRLARLEYDVPAQDDRISLSRMPARPRSGMVLRTAA
jgi:fatty-acid peroxygenase